MGLFDTVTVPAQNCRRCQAPLKGWQSKDGPCLLLTLEFYRVSRFYTACGRCQTWHEYVLRDRVRPLSDYQLHVGGPGDDAVPDGTPVDDEPGVAPSPAPGA